MNENRGIPDVRTIEQLRHALNVRFRELDEQLRRVVENPARGDFSLDHRRVVAMGDPKDDLDGVNLRTLRRFVAPVPVTEPAVEAVEALPVAYTAVFTKDGLVADGELSPWFTVNELREGDPVVASLTASTAPTINPLLVQFRVYPPASSGAAAYDLFSEDFKLNPGETGPVYSKAFTDGRRLAVGSLVEMRIITGGSAEKVVGELVVRRPAA